MCGITAIVGGDPRTLDQRIRAMTAPLALRGPDAEGHLVDETAGVALGHRRLKIIDLLERANQPMFSEDGRVSLVFNGEIYNFRDLRHRLQTSGHTFRTTGDSEVLLHAYLEWGEECLSELIGMFAFVIWDRRRSRLFCARDRLGEKPLCYAFWNGALHISSEVKSFRALPDWPSPRISPEGLFVHFSTTSIPAPFSIYADVRRLAPAHCFAIDLDAPLGPDSIREKPYWSLRFDCKRDRTDAEIRDETLALMSDIVSKQLVSDVPIGVLLSGGVDSSLIVALAAGESENVATLCIGRPESEDGGADPEFARARFVAERFHTKHQEMNFYYAPDDLLSQIVRALDEPFSRTDGLFMHELWRRLSDSVVVALTGNGADELFGGYSPSDRSPFSLGRRLIHAAAGWGLRAGLRPPGRLGTRFETWGSVGARRWKDVAWLYFCDLFQYGRVADALHADASFDLEGARRGVRAALDETVERWRPTSEHDVHMAVQLYLANVFGTVMCSDASGMSFSLEVRSPFLDHRLVEFAASLRDRDRIRPDGDGVVTKWPLKLALETFLPRSFVRQPKIGMGTHIESLHLVRRSYAGRVNGVMHAGRVLDLGIFDADRLRALHQRFVDGDDSQLQLFFSLLTLDEWLRQNEGARL